MSRSPRIEYAGAVYHVMSRGDHRELIFQDNDDRKMFLETLGEVCERTGWKMHCYVLMPNHYHWLLETPRACLVDGMRWFQTTYTARYNARHRQCGHLFQGRYKAIVVDSSEADYFRTLSDYIHLNPVRAHLLKKKSPQLEDFFWSSYPAYIGGRKRSAWLETRRVLKSHGMTRLLYRSYMEKRVREVLSSGKELDEEWKSIRRGWVLGDEDFRQEMLEYIGEQMEPRHRESYSGEEVKAVDQKKAERLLKRGLQVLGLTQEELQSLKTTDRRKQALTWLIRSSTLASSDWMRAELGLGHRSNISRAMRTFKSAKSKDDQLKQKMLQCKD